MKLRTLVTLSMFMAMNLEPLIFGSASASRAVHTGA
jgi:hypothetical protein